MFQKILFLGIALLAFKGLQAKDPPNVIIIYGDDVGYGDVGANGAKLIPTPNLDKLASQGLMFSDAHCGASTCTPSRYSLLTGQFAFRKKGTGILPGDAKMAISPDQFTLPDLFKKAGYKTAAVGKWHLGLGDGITPIDWNGEIAPGPPELGFDYTFILPATNDRVPCVYLENHRIVNLDQSDPITVTYKMDEPLTGTYPDGVANPEAMTFYKSSHGHNNSVINGIGRIGYMSGGRSALWKDETMAEVLMGKAAEFIRANKDEPFFLYLASQDIHVPRVPHPRFRGKTDLGYRGDAMVELDWTVGEMMKLLDELGLAENTLLIFSSDNGPVYDDGYEDGTIVHTSTEEVDQGHDGSGIYRGGKYQIYEGGTRVPLIIRWPEKIRAGISDALVSQVDFLASFADLLGVEIPGDAAPDSRNYFRALTGEDKTGAESILEQGRGLALRKGQWKYIEPQTGLDSKVMMVAQLYNLEQDISESNNVINEHPEIANKLEMELELLKQKSRWSTKKAQEWYDDQDWLVGANFLPSSAINQIEMFQASSWDPETINRELGWAAGLGMNVMRVYLHDLLYDDDPEGMLKRMDEYLEISMKHGIKTLFVFWDDCHFSQPKLGKQRDPIPGVHNSGWNQSPGEALVLAYHENTISKAENERLKKYVQDILRHFSGDERILAWDLYNEPGGRMLKERTNELLKDTWKWAWEVRPSQPLTACRHGASEGNGQINLLCSDIVSFHSYDPLEATKKRIQELTAVRPGVPIICTEYMARTNGSTFEAILPYFKQEKIAAINWGLVSGKSGTIWPWTSRKERTGPVPVPSVPPEESPEEPELWFHDIFRPDGTPYIQEEVDLIRQLTGRGK